MSALFVLIGISLALSASFVAVCILSIRSGQFDDLESPKWRVLFAETKETLPLKPLPLTPLHTQSKNGIFIEDGPK